MVNIFEILDWTRSAHIFEEGKFTEEGFTTQIFEGSEHSKGNYALKGEELS